MHPRMKLSQTLPVHILIFFHFVFFLLQAATPVPVEGGSAEEKSGSQSWSFAPDPSLPNVLILGDSISIGYTLFVRAELKKEANIWRPMDRKNEKPFNCGDSARGLELVDGWLGTNLWRVIHFNFGLHDLKYLNEKKQYVSPDQGKQVAPPELYEKNLRALTARLKKTGAVLVWASTTPVPEGSPGRIQGDEIAFNSVAKKVMEENGVLINDLYGSLAGRISELQKPNNVHFTDEGSKVLAASVTTKIREALKKPAASPSPVEPSHIHEFRLASPVTEAFRSESLYGMATLIFPHPVIFKPGLVIETSAEVESPLEPVSFNAQILSVEGKLSSLVFRGAEKSKKVSARLEIPESPALHPTSKSKDPWKEGDLIKQIRIYFTFPSKITGTIRVNTLTLAPK